MKDIRIQNDLFSVKSINDNYVDRTYFVFLIEKLLESTGLLYVEANKDNYNITRTLESLKKQIHIIDNLQVGKRMNDISFSFYKEKLEIDMLHNIIDIWFAYEHCAFCFFKDKSTPLPEKRKAWYDITKKTKSYVMFKGIEEDVVWIGKSHELEFNDIGIR